LQIIFSVPLLSSLEIWYCMNYDYFSFLCALLFHVRFFSFFNVVDGKNPIFLEGISLSAGISRVETKFSSRKKSWNNFECRKYRKWKFPKLSCKCKCLTKLLIILCFNLSSTIMNYEGSSLSGRVGEFHLKSNYKKELFHVLFCDKFFWFEFSWQFSFSILKFFGFCLSSFYADDSDCYGFVDWKIDKRLLLKDFKEKVSNYKWKNFIWYVKL
jgi:hypothetical protein